MQLFIRVFAVFNFANGVFILAAPGIWYEMTPGVTETGPLNLHFVRDIGIAFLAAGVGLWTGVANHPLRPLSGACVAMIFVGGHALLHVVEMFRDQPDIASILLDLGLIVIPVLVAATWLIGEVRRQMLSDPQPIELPKTGR